MKYKVSITGGFTGIPREYEGELDLEEDKEKQLLGILSAAPSSKNELLRDGRIYRIELTTGSRDFRSEFDDSNLPSELRSFIDEIRDH
jgi:hypothetical protein